MPQQYSSMLLLQLLVVVLSLVCCCSAANVSATAQSSRRYTLLVEELTGGLDETDSRPTLVSVTEDITLTLPATAAAAAAWEGDAESSEIDADVAARLTFDEDFDPIWYYVLRRRGFEHLDWSGCGGKWRPEWSIPQPRAATTDATSRRLFAQLHHYLAHHAVCTYSSVSFCGASHERDASSQFQWAAQFISTLTSTPLSWTDASPHHSRPSGVLLESAVMDNASNADGAYWCSYHLVYHDTLCTQHVSPLLNGGRSGRGVQEGLPPGIFKAVFPSFVHFFGSPFHHFTVKATQRRRPADAARGTPAAVVLAVQMRMTMVVREAAELAALADVWRRELPAYASDGRLDIYIGPGGLSRKLRTALPASALVSPAPADGVEKKKDGVPVIKHADAAGGGGEQDSTVEGTAAGSSVGWSPEVMYEVHSHGKDHSYLTVELQPGLATLDAQASVKVATRSHSEEDANGSDDAHNATTSSTHAYRLQEGDIVRALLLFPLHLVRPSLYNMESLLGATHLVHAHTDVSSNTLAVLLETPITSMHVAAYEAAYAQARRQQQQHRRGAEGRRGGPQGVLLARFPLFFGWTALHEMPPDDNSNRIVPQPIVVITRPVTASASSTAAESDFCRAQRETTAGLSFGGVPPLDHVSSLSAIFQLLNHTFEWRDGKKAAETLGQGAEQPLNAAAGGTCVYWVRSTMASGTFIPGPDGAMVFNVLSLGLVFSAVGAGTLTRLTRRLTLQQDGLAALVKDEAK